MSLRKFLKVHRPITIRESVSVDDEMAFHIRNVCDSESFPILMKDEKYLNWVIGGVYATEDRVKSIFSYLHKKKAILSNFEAVKCFAEADEFALSYSAQFQNGNVEPIIIEDQKDSKSSLFDVTLSNDAILSKSEDINVWSLPICKHNEKDAGRFITAGVNVVEGVDGKTQGLGIHRMQVINKHTISCLAPPNRRIGLPFYEASKKGKPIKMAVVIGAPPEVVLASQSKIPQNKEKYLVASHIRGDMDFNNNVPLELVKLEYSGLLVPKNSELVLECESIPDSLHSDVPFGEYPGTYSFRSNSWLLKVRRIHHGFNYIYQTILTGKLPQEDSNLCGIPYAAEVYKSASKLAKVTDISSFLGNNVFDTIVCVEKESNEQIQNLLYTLLGNKYLKSVTVMDSDLQANEKDFRFAFNTRYQPNRDTIITNLSLGASLDPSSPLFQSTSKIGFDMTIPHGKNNEETNLNKFRHSLAVPKDFPGKRIKYPGVAEVIHKDSHLIKYD